MEKEDLSEFLESFLAAIAKLSEAAKHMEVLMPAIIIGARTLILSQMDMNRPGWKDRKEVLYLFEREVIGAWVVKNSSTTVGEGAGLLLMGLSPFSETLGDIVDAAEDVGKKFDAAADKLWDKSERGFGKGVLRPLREIPEPF